MDGASVETAEIRRRQLENSAPTFRGPCRQRLRVLVAEQQFIAVQIPAVMVVQTEPMACLNGTSPSGGVRKKRFPCLRTMALAMLCVTDGTPLVSACSFHHVIRVGMGVSGVRIRKGLGPLNDPGRHWLVGKWPYEDASTRSTRQVWDYTTSRILFSMTVFIMSQRSFCPAPAPSQIARLARW